MRDGGTGMERFMKERLSGRWRNGVSCRCASAFEGGAARGRGTEVRRGIFPRVRGAESVSPAIDPVMPGYVAVYTRSERTGIAQ